MVMMIWTISLAIVSFICIRVNRINMVSMSNISDAILARVKFVISFSFCFPLVLLLKTYFLLVMYANVTAHIHDNTLDIWTVRLFFSMKRRFANIRYDITLIMVVNTPKIR